MDTRGARLALTQAVEHLRLATSVRISTYVKDLEPAVRYCDGHVSCPQGRRG